MHDSDVEETSTDEQKDLRGFGVACCVRFCVGLVLIILGVIAVDKGYYRDEPRGIPYFIGAFLTGFTMSVMDVVNYRNWRSIIWGNASLSQRTKFLRVETVICGISVMIGFFGIIVVSANGVQTPWQCRDYFGDCTVEDYHKSYNYKLSLAILLVLILSVFVNMVCVFLPVKCRGEKDNNSSDNQQPLTQRDNVTEHRVLSCQHQPLTQTYSSVVQSPSGHHHLRDQQNICNQIHVLVGGIESTAVTLNDQHGQRQGHTDAVLPNDSQQPTIQGTYSLISELQEQNRLLREQLALQQRRLEQQERIIVPTASTIESPPSYETCMTGPQTVNYSG